MANQSDIASDRNGGWVPWSDKNEQCAPVLGLHKHEPFPPTHVEAFLDEHCEFMIQVDLTSDGPVYAKVKRFAELPSQQKLQRILTPKFNKRTSYLDRYGEKIDMRKSAQLQEKAPVQVYVRGFRNEQTNQAYITYWFFYLENFVPHSKKDHEIEERLQSHPESLWTHEGDWEGLSMRFDRHSDSHPATVYFSRHGKMLPVQWDDLRKEDGRVLVMPGVGTHANFNKPLRKSRVLGLVAEVAQPDRLYSPGGNGIDGSSYGIEELDPRHQHLWLHFKGRWGQGASLVGTAPTGPLWKKNQHLELLADKHLRKPRR